MDSPLYAASRFAVEVAGRPVALSEVLGLAFVPDLKPAATVTLRRAAGSDRTLLDWAIKPAVRPVVVALLSPTGDPLLRYLLEGARPVAWHGPELNATSTDVAREELVLAVDRINLR